MVNNELKHHEVGSLIINAASFRSITIWLSEDRLNKIPSMELHLAMENYMAILGEISRFLDNHSVTSLARTCRTLSVIARDELRQRVRRYLKSGTNTRQHGFYPILGYYGRRFDDDGNEMDAGEGSWWSRCLYEHHKKLYVGDHCSCEFFRTSRGLEKVLS